MTTRKLEYSQVPRSREDDPATSQTRPEGAVSSAGPRAWGRRHLPFLATAIPWLSAVYAVAGSSNMEVFTLGLGLLLLGVPICLAGTCTSLLRQLRWLSSLLRRQGSLYALLSGRWLGILIWMALALGMSFVLLLQIHVYERVEWAILAATVPLFTVVFAFIQRQLLNAGLHTDMAVIVALVWARWICPVMLIVLHVATMMWWGDLPRYESIEAAVAAHTPESAERSGSVLVREALLWAGYFDGMKAYTLSHLPGSTDALEPWILSVLVLGNFLLLYFTCLALSCFRLPRAAFVRARLAPRSTKDVFMVVAFATFFIPFLYFPGLAQLEWSVSQSQEPARVREMVWARMTPIVRLVVDQIDGDYYEPGTKEQIERARSEAAIPVGEAAEELRREVDATFERLEGEATDEYLDWYYSLTAEWVRVFTLLTGGAERLENHLAEKVRETFEQEKLYTGINTAFERLMAADEEARKAYEQTVRNILQRNRVDSQRLQNAEVDIASVASIEDILQLSFHQDFIPAAHRFAGAGGGIGIGYIIAQKVKAKILAKFVLKVAAKAPLKVLASKVGSVAVTAATGAAAGSAVPGLGTVAGAVVGAGTGIAIEGALLKLEEALSRDDFRREIVTAIREARSEFKHQYLGEPDPA